MMSTAYLLSRPLLRAFSPFKFRRASTPLYSSRCLATPSNSHGASVAAGVRVDHAEEIDNQTVAAMGRTKAGKSLKVRKYPTFTRLEDERLYRKQHLAAAYRVFASRGFDEGVAGHISVRDPIMTDHFWLNPLSTHFSLMRVSDLILVNEEGEVVEGDQPINAAAFAIHSAIHKRRPEVHAACHAHSVHGKAFSAFGRELDMITQDSVRFYKSHGVYNQFGGMVLASEEGERIADALGAYLLQNYYTDTIDSEQVKEKQLYFKIMVYSL